MFPNVLNSLSPSPQHSPLVSTLPGKEETPPPLGVPPRPSPFDLGAPSELLMVPRDLTEKRAIRVVCVGVDSYAGELGIPSLLTSAYSVDNIIKLITTKIPTYGAEVSISATLVNEQATSKAFREALDGVQRATRRRMPTDIVIVYFAGHGRIRLHSGSGLTESVIVLYDGGEVPVIDLVNYFNTEHYAAYIIVDAGFGVPENDSIRTRRTSGLPLRIVGSEESAAFVLPTCNVDPSDEKKSLGGGYGNVFGNNICLWSAVIPPLPGKTTGLCAIEGLFTEVLTFYLSHLASPICAPLTVVHTLMMVRLRSIDQEFFLDGYLGFFENFGLLLSTHRPDREQRYAAAIVSLRNMPPVCDGNPSTPLEQHLAMIRTLYNSCSETHETGRVCVVHLASVSLEHPRHIIVSLTNSEEAISQVRLDEICKGDLDSRGLKKLIGYRGRTERMFQVLMAYGVPDLQAYAFGERFYLIKQESVLVDTCWISRMWLARYFLQKMYVTSRAALLYFPSSRLSACEPEMLEKAYKGCNMEVVTLRETQCTSGVLVWVLAAVQSGLQNTNDPRVLTVHISCESVVLAGGEHILVMSDTTQTVGSGDELRVLSAGVKYSSVVEATLVGLPRNVTVYFVLDTSKRRVIMPPMSSPACDERYVEPGKPTPHKRGPAHGIHLHAAHDMFHSLGVVGCSNFAREYAQALRHHVSKSLTVQNLMDSLGEGLRRAAAVGGQVQYVSYSGPVHGAVLDSVPAHAGPSQAFALLRCGENRGGLEVAGGRVHGLCLGDTLRYEKGSLGVEYEIVDVHDYSACVVRRSGATTAPHHHPQFLRRVFPGLSSVALFSAKDWHYTSISHDTKGHILHQGITFNFHLVVESHDSTLVATNTAQDTLVGYVDFLSQRPPAVSLYLSDNEFKVTHNIPAHPLSCNHCPQSLCITVAMPSQIPLEEEGIYTSYLTLIGVSPSFGIHLMHQSAVTSTTMTIPFNLDGFLYPEQFSSDETHFARLSATTAFALVRLYVSSEPLSCLPLQVGLHAIAVNVVASDEADTVDPRPQPLTRVPQRSGLSQGRTTMSQYTFIDMPFALALK